MRKVIIVTILILSSQLLNAQQLFSVFGGSYQSESLSVSYAAGEVIVGTQSNSDDFYLQGLIQPMLGADIGTKAEEIKISELAINVFPNPTSGNLNIVGEELRRAKVVVYDLCGNIVTKVQENISDRVLLNLNNESKGVYLVRVISGNKQFNRKVILK